MSRWSAPAECYLVNALYEPVAGPFSRSTPLVALIDRLYREHGKTYYYGNASRYQLAKEGKFPRTKAGDEALKAAVAANADLEAQVLPLLGQASFSGWGYTEADWAAIDALLSARGIGRPLDPGAPVA
jgi:hypothetical protein